MESSVALVLALVLVLHDRAGKGKGKEAVARRQPPTPEIPHTIQPMWVGGHELALIVAVLALVTLGPPAAGAVVAWVRRRRRRRSG